MFQFKIWYDLYVYHCYNFQKYLATIMKSLSQVALKASKPLIFGMVHVQPLPGSPLNKLSICGIEELAVQEATTLAEYDLQDGILVENMHDVPYRRASQLQPDTVACMTRVCCAIAKQLQPHMFIGVQILSAANVAAMAVAQAAGVHFIRCEGYVFGHIGDEGYVESCAADLQRYRKQIGAENIEIITDIKKKHSAHSMTSDVSLETTAEAAQFFLSDGVVITGQMTGDPPEPHMIGDVKKRVSIPVIVGSGVTHANVQSFMNAHALIIGSHFKEDGQWHRQLDKTRVEQFMNKFKKL